MTITATTANIDCEVCGAPGAKVVTPASGGTAEMCTPCHRDEIQQAKIDALAAKMGDMLDDEFEALLARI